MHPQADSNATFQDVNHASNLIAGANRVHQDISDNKVPVHVNVSICNNTTYVVIAVVILSIAVVAGVVKVYYWQTLDLDTFSQGLKQKEGVSQPILKPVVKLTVYAQKFTTKNQIPVDVILSDSTSGKTLPQTVDQFSDYIEYDHENDKYLLVYFYSDQNIEVHPSNHKLLLQSNEQKLSVITRHNQNANILNGYYQVGAKKTEFQLTLSSSLHKYTIQISYEKPFIKLKLESVEDDQNVALETGLHTFCAPSTVEATISLEKSNIEIEFVPNLPFIIPLYKAPFLQEFFVVEKSANEGLVAFLALSISIGQTGDFDFIQTLLLQ